MTPTSRLCHTSITESIEYNIASGPVQLHIVKIDRGLKWSEAVYISKQVRNDRVEFMLERFGSKTKVYMGVRTGILCQVYSPVTGADVSIYTTYNSN